MTYKSLKKANLKLLIFLSVILFPLLASAQATKVMSKKERMSYALGVTIARQLDNQFSAVLKQLDEDTFIRAMETILKGKHSALRDEEVVQAMQEVLKLAEPKENNNLETGKEYMTENGKKPGVFQTPSGIQYEIIKSAQGPKPSISDQVKVHYEGTLTTGDVFDSSYARGEPASFPLRGVIAGWTEILQLMPVGSTWRVVIPSELAYGARGAGSDIPPNSTLIFKIELLEIL